MDFLRWKVLERSPIPLAYTPPVVAIDSSAQRKLLELEPAVTWIGHSSFFLRVAGQSILLDPVFSDFCAPIRLRRLKRRIPPGTAIELRK